MISTKERYNRFIEYFNRTMPSATTELIYTNPYELLVAVILSAQCTDKRVNMVTPDFFKRFPTPETLAVSNVEEVYELVKSCTYPNSKAKHLVGMAKTLLARFGGKVPDDVELLQQLPGVGRKTANVVASVAFNQPAMPVDTHVFRVARRIGLVTNAKTPLAVERQLTEKIPSELLAKAHHWLILHGRYVCTARNPKCSECGLNDICKDFQNRAKNTTK
jgi:endonuclease-3